MAEAENRPLAIISRLTLMLVDNPNVDLDENEREQLMIYLEAFATFMEREAKYQSLWKRYGAVDSYHHVTSKAARVQFYLQGNADDSDPIDLINYTVFLIRNVRAGRMVNMASEGQADWLAKMPKEVLVELHHSVRMMSGYPGLSAEEIDKYVKLADLLWQEHTGRVTARG